MSKVNMPSLLEEPPIVLYPSLAKALGVNQAAIFQQLHYLLTATKVGKSKYNLVDGKWWVYNTYEEWQEYFIWLSVSAIKQMFLALEDLGIVISQQGVKKATDRRKWYTIDYDAWQKFRESIGQNLSDDETKNVPSMNGQNLSDDYTDNIDSTENILPIGKKGRLNVPFVTALATDSPMPDVVEPEKKVTHPLRKRGKNGASNPYTCAVAYFWSGRPYSEWSQADKQGEGFRFNKLFETGGALELLYEELGGFTPEQLADALKAWCIQNPDTPPKSRPREQKLYSHIAPLLRQIVTTASQKIVSIESTPTTDWREHARLAQLRKENGK